MIHPLIRMPVAELLLRMECGDAHGFSDWTEAHRVRVTRTNYKEWSVLIKVPVYGIDHHRTMKLADVHQVLRLMPGSSRMALKSHLLDGHIRDNPLDYTPEKLAVLDTQAG